jgi:putative endonuclease
MTLMPYTWVVYLLECSDNTYYCGITNNIHKRFDDHNSGKGAKYTRGRTPVVLRFYKYVVDKSEALKLEYRIKQFSRKQKEEIIKYSLLPEDIIKINGNKYYINKIQELHVWNGIDWKIMTDKEETEKIITQILRKKKLERILNEKK